MRRNARIGGISNYVKKQDHARRDVSVGFVISALEAPEGVIAFSRDLYGDGAAINAQECKAQYATICGEAGRNAGRMR